MKELTQEKIYEAIENFRFEGRLTDCRPYGSGHINDTFLLSYEIGEMGRLKVILQRMNKLDIRIKGKQVLISEI